MLPPGAAIVCEEFELSRPSRTVLRWVARHIQTPAPAQNSLAGQLLVASPSMADPRFARTVILMVRHDPDGAFGIVVNRLFGERPLADLLEMIGEKDATVTGTVRIFALASISLRWRCEFSSKNFCRVLLP